MTENKRKAKNYIVYDFVRITAAIPGVLWFRPKVLYENAAARQKLRGGILMIANHVGFFDPVYMMLSIWYRRQHFVCTKEFFEGRFKSWLFGQFHCIPIDRENFSMDSLRRITGELKDGRLVSMFPEGHVNFTGGIAPFKAGMILIAVQSGCPIVPIYIKKPKRFYNRLVVALGEPIDVKALYGERPALDKIDEAAALLHDKEILLEKLSEAWPNGREPKNK